MKHLTLFISIILYLFTTVTTLAQPVREGVNIAPDTSSSITVNEFKNLSFQNFQTSPKRQQFTFNYPQHKSVNFNKTAKTLLKIGTSIIRGDNENYPIYSLDNAWKYPGPTVQYPETVTEFELFLSRFNRHNIDKN